MIKFFRRLRQKLLSENNFTKYLLYAFGEIVLVVIGILIALQINNMNEDKKAQVYEKKMLLEIRKALVKDVDFFKSHLIGKRLARVQEASQFFEHYLLTDSINTDSINYHFNGLTNGLQLTYNKGPFEALKSTGIDRVMNDSLRNMIIDLYEFKIPRAAGLIGLQMEEYMKNSIKHAERLSDDLTVETSNGKVTYHYTAMKQVELKTDQSFLTLLSWASNTSVGVTALFNNIIPEMETLIIAIDEELVEMQ